MTIQPLSPASITQPDLFEPLLTYLDKLILKSVSGYHHTWRDWQISPIEGGRNNLLFRVAGQPGAFAVKFTIRDARQRARREYEGLRAVAQAGLKVAPRPILLEPHRFSQPVVVQEWLAGPVAPTPPQTETEWTHLLHLFVALAKISPEKTTFPLRPAMINFGSATDGLAAIRSQTKRLPQTEWPSQLPALLRKVEATTFPTWPKPQSALCHVDANIQNVVRRAEGWAFVDWENSGWGDPVFEVADLMTHPAYMDVPRSPWERVVQIYCNLIEDETAALRIRVYYNLMLVWWVVRWTRYLYEIPRGLDDRLVTPPEDWQATMETKRQGYLQLAWEVGKRDWGW